MIFGIIQLLKNYVDYNILVKRKALTLIIDPDNSYWSFRLYDNPW